MTDPIATAETPVVVNTNDPLVKTTLGVVSMIIVGACGYFIRQGLITEAQAGLLASVLAPVVIGAATIVWRAMSRHKVETKLATVAADPRVPDSLARVQ